MSQEIDAAAAAEACRRCGYSDIAINPSEWIAAQLALKAQGITHDEDAVAIYEEFAGGHGA